MFDFAQSSGPQNLPDYHEDFPIITSGEQYAEHQGEYLPFYFVFDADDSNEFSLMPEDTVHEFRWNVEEITIWEPRTFGYDLYGTLYAANGDFSVDYEQEKLILDSIVKEDLKQYALSTSKELILEVKAKKYHNLSVALVGGRNYTQEELSHIALMQGIQADLLNYQYQFELGVSTASLASEAIFTGIVTVWTVPLSFVGTYGFGLLAKQAFPSLGVKILGSLADQLAKQGVGKMFVWSALKEVGEEIIRDPILEATVRQITGQAWGWSELGQMLASVVVESGREGLSGIFDFSSHADKQMKGFSSFLSEQGYSAMNDPDSSQIQQLYQEYRTIAQDKTSIQRIGGITSKSLSTLITFGTALAGVASGGMAMLGLGSMMGIGGLVYKTGQLQLQEKKVSKQLQDIHKELIKQEVKLDKPLTSNMDYRTAAKLLREKGMNLQWRQLKGYINIFGLKSLNDYLDHAYAFSELLLKGMSAGAVRTPLEMYNHMIISIKQSLIDTLGLITFEDSTGKVHNIRSVEGFTPYGSTYVAAEFLGLLNKVFIKGWRANYASRNIFLPEGNFLKLLSGFKIRIVEGLAKGCELSEVKENWDIIKESVMGDYERQVAFKAPGTFLKEYREFRYALAKLFYVNKIENPAGEVMTSSNAGDFDRKFLYLDGLEGNIKKGNIPNINDIDKKRSKLLGVYEDQLVEKELMETFNYIFYELIQKIRDQQGDDSIFTAEELNTARGQLIRDISNLFPYKTFRSVSDLSKFLFGTGKFLKGIFLKPKYLKSRAQLNRLFRMVFNIRKLSRNRLSEVLPEFKLLEILTDADIEYIKRNAEKLIDDFVMSNPYAHLKSREYYPTLLSWSELESTYDLIKHVWLSVADHEDDSSIPLNKAARKVGLSHSLGYVFHGGASFGVQQLADMRKAINRYLDEILVKVELPSDYWSLELYLDALHKIDNYFSELPTMREKRIAAFAEAYHDDFNKPWVRRFIIFSNLLLMRGFDPVSFVPLEDDLFVKGGYSILNEEGEKKKYVYQLHHWILSMPGDLRKLSLHNFHLVIVSSQYHKSVYDSPFFKGVEGTQRMLVILKAFMHLIQQDRVLTVQEAKNLINKEFTPDEVDIINQYWEMDSDNFKNNIGVLNKRLELMTAQGYNTFLTELYKETYKRGKGQKFTSFLEKLEDINQVGMYVDFLNNFDVVDVEGLTKGEKYDYYKNIYYATSEVIKEFMGILPPRVTAGPY